MYQQRKVKRYLPVFLGFLALFSLACNLTNTVTNAVANKVGNAITGSGNAGSVTTMWRDVPQMDGLKQENLDLPLAAKVALRTVMNGGANGQVNFIAFTTTQTAQEVEAYYTVDRMTQAGWNQSDQIGCAGTPSDNTNSSATNTVSGGFCLFAKDTGNNKASLLGIFIGQDSASNQTQVFFMRADGVPSTSSTPTPGG